MKYFFSQWRNFLTSRQSMKTLYNKRKWTITCINSKASSNACTNTQMNNLPDMSYLLYLVCPFIELTIPNIKALLLFSNNVLSSKNYTNITTFLYANNKLAV